MSALARAGVSYVSQKFITGSRGVIGPKLLPVVLSATKGQWPALDSPYSCTMFLLPPSSCGLRTLPSNMPSLRSGWQGAAKDYKEEPSPLRGRRRIRESLLPLPHQVSRFTFLIHVSAAQFVPYVAHIFQVGLEVGEVVVEVGGYLEEAV